MGFPQSTRWPKKTTQLLMSTFFHNYGEQNLLSGSFWIYSANKTWYVLLNMIFFPIFQIQVGGNWADKEVYKVTNLPPLGATTHASTTLCAIIAASWSSLLVQSRAIRWNLQRGETTWSGRTPANVFDSSWWQITVRFCWLNMKTSGNIWK